MKTTTNAAADIREMIAAWNRIEAAARAQFPAASEDEIYKLTCGAMNHALKIKT